MNNLEAIARDLRAMQGDMKRLGDAIKIGLCEDFTTTVQDIELCIQGDYERDDADVGYVGGYQITRAWIPTDLQATDIKDLLTKDATERIESEGADIMYQRAIEEAEDRADYLANMER